MGRDAVSGAIQLGLDSGMGLIRIRTIRNRVALAILNLFAVAANRNRRHAPRGNSQNENVARILVVELWNIGDVILAMPFLAHLRYLFPRARITLLAKPFAADLLAGTGLVDDYIRADLAWAPADRATAPGKAIDLWRVSRTLRRQKFDVAFSSRAHLREHFILVLSGANRRVGLSMRHASRALTDPIQVGSGQRHKVQDWMRLLQPFGGASSIDLPRLRVAESERMWATGYLASNDVQANDLLIGIHPGASLPEKRWPLEEFRQVATALIARPGVRVLAFAEPSGYGSELFAIQGVIGAQVGLRELIALIDRCDLLVCNDSGPMHIAGALGVPTVAMFGQGIERWFAPLGEGHEMLIPEAKLSSALGSRAGSIRAPIGISSAQVLAAVERTMQRLRNGNTFSSL